MVAQTNPFTENLRRHPQGTSEPPSNPGRFKSPTTQLRADTNKDAHPASSSTRPHPHLTTVRLLWAGCSIASKS